MFILLIFSYEYFDFALVFSLCNEMPLNFVFENLFFRISSEFRCFWQLNNSCDLFAFCVRFPFCTRWANRNLFSFLRILSFKLASDCQYNNRFIYFSLMLMASYSLLSFLMNRWIHLFSDLFLLLLLPLVSINMFFGWVQRTYQSYVVATTKPSIFKKKTLNDWLLVRVCVFVYGGIRWIFLRN